MLVRMLIHMLVDGAHAPGVARDAKHMARGGMYSVNRRSIVDRQSLCFVSGLRAQRDLRQQVCPQLGLELLPVQREHPAPLPRGVRPTARAPLGRLDNGRALRLIPPVRMAAVRRVSIPWSVHGRVLLAADGSTEGHVPAVSLGREGERLKGLSCMRGLAVWRREHGQQHDALLRVPCC